MKSRFIYQALLFFNSTVLYAFVVRITGARDLLFFSAFMGALSLTANLAVQLSDSQFRSAVLALKIASIALLSWACLRSGINPPAVALAIGIFVIMFVHRDALIGSPRISVISIVSAPIIFSASWSVLAWQSVVPFNTTVMLALLISPYLLAVISNRESDGRLPKTSDARERMHALTLILSQLLPTVSAFLIFMLVSYEKDSIAAANYVLIERAIAIGGSLIYFYARVKGGLNVVSEPMAYSFLVIMALIASSIGFNLPTAVLGFGFFLAGCTLSYGTISLGAQHARGILAINGVALIAVLWVAMLARVPNPASILAIYVCPQLLLMGFLILLVSRDHA